jgi:hypothetical protein
MKTLLFALLILIQDQLYAHGQIISVTTTRYPSHVCYGGRTLTGTSVGFVWEANRSCFISHKPCANYQANHYGTYFNPQHLRFAYAHCRSAQPFRWGEQQ